MYGTGNFKTRRTFRLMLKKLAPLNRIFPCCTGTTLYPSEVYPVKNQNHLEEGNLHYRGFLFLKNNCLEVFPQGQNTEADTAVFLGVGPS